MGYQVFDIIVKVETWQRVYSSEDAMLRGMESHVRKLGTENMRANSYMDACQLASTLHSTHRESDGRTEIERTCEICVRVSTRIGPLTIPWHPLDNVIDALRHALQQQVSPTPIAV
jgi:hypothetical protein